MCWPRGKKGRDCVGASKGMSKRKRGVHFSATKRKKGEGNFYYRRKRKTLKRTIRGEGEKGLCFEQGVDFLLLKEGNSKRKGGQGRGRKEGGEISFPEGWRFPLSGQLRLLEKINYGGGGGEVLNPISLERKKEATRRRKRRGGTPSLSDLRGRDGKATCSITCAERRKK